jgi:hypothetical protein
LLRNNPAEVPDIADWRTLVAELPGSHVALIERDLQMQQKMRNRAP